METDLILNKLNIHKNIIPLYVYDMQFHFDTGTLYRPVQTAYGEFDALTHIYPEIYFKTESGKIVVGFGECAPLNAPYYNYECPKTVKVALDYIKTSLLADKNPITDIFSYVNRYSWIVGHNIAKCGIEAAYWDAVSKVNNISIKDLWGGTRDKVEAGVSLGIETDFNEFFEDITHAINNMSIKRIKIKIKPGWDITVIEAIRKQFPNIPLQVDANASYDLFNKNHLALLKELDNYNLLMIEQPGRNDDIYDHSKQLNQLSTPICLDESILNEMHARQAIELWNDHSSLDKLIINIKPQRVGGYLEAIKIAHLCGINNVNTWCGGMYESVIGKLFNIIFSSRSEVNLPGDHVSVTPTLYVCEDDFIPYSMGCIPVPTTPGTDEYYT